MNAIEVKNLSYTYPDGTKALDGINFNIEENQTVSIIGPNGAGKTTLLLALTGILKTEGEIKILNEILNNGNLKRIRRDIGFLFQDPDDQLFTPTVYEDVAFGPLNFSFPKEEIPAIVRNSLSVVGLSGFENRSPHHLSFGERKKVSLATILSYNPRIFLLDEPTSNLDPKSRREFMELLKKISVTKIIATHDLEMVLELSEKVILINKGVKVAEGNPKEILSNREVMEKNNLEVPLSLRLK